MSSFTSKFRRCFYEMSKELFDLETKPTRAGPRQYYDVFFFFWTLRVPFVVYVMYIDYEVDGWWWYDFRRNDILVSYLYKFRSTLDYTTFLMVFFFDIIYFILSYWCFKLDVRGRNWRFWYQMTVLSLDQYYECRLSGSRLKRIQALKRVKYEEKLAQFWLPGGLVKTVSGAFASVEIAARMEDVDVSAMQSRPLPVMPFLSWKARAKGLRLMLITEAFAYVFQVTVVIIYIITIFGLIYIYPYWNRHPWYIKVYEFIEMICPLVFLIWLIRYVILFTTLTIQGTLVSTSHVLEWQDKVKDWLKKFSHSKEGTCVKWSKGLVVLPLSGRLLLERFLREHNLVTYLTVSCSMELWGKIILATICTQIPINVIFVRKMFVSVSGDDEALSSLRYILFLICFVQLLLFAIIFLPLGWCQKVYHSPKKFIPRFLLLSTGSGAWWWTLRLKYNDLYGRLMRGPKFALSVGELHAITYLSAMEFLFSYIAYLLMAFSTKNII